MQSVYGGCVIRQIELTLKQKYASKKFLIYILMVVEKRLKSIKPPSCVRRPPRAIKNMAYWIISKIGFESY